MSKKKKPRIAVLCEDCGGDSIYSDAGVNWSVDKQEWELGDIWGEMYCNTCGCEVETIDLDLDEEAERHPIGTRKAVLVGPREAANSWSSDPPLYLCGVDLEEKHYPTPGHIEAFLKVQEGELVILKKVTAWQWELVENKAMEAGA